MYVRSGSDEIAIPVLEATCCDCGESFERSEAEIRARRGTGMSVSPRCSACREVRRAERNAHMLTLLRSGDLREVRPGTIGPPAGAERLYPAVCHACQRSIRLPFDPSHHRPVLCRFCLETRNGR